jgi:hypothetical protein
MQSVRLGMANNIVEEIFHFLCTKKLILHFMSEINGFFVKQLPKFTLVFVPTQSPKILDHFICIFYLLIESKKCCSIFHIFDNFLQI